MDEKAHRWRKGYKISEKGGDDTKLETEFLKPRKKAKIMVNSNFDGEAAAADDDEQVLKVKEASKVTDPTGELDIKNVKYNSSEDMKEIKKKKKKKKKHKCYEDKSIIKDHGGEEVSSLKEVLDYQDSSKTGQSYLSSECIDVALINSSEKQPKDLNISRKKRKRRPESNIGIGIILQEEEDHVAADNERTGVLLATTDVGIDRVLSACSIESDRHEMCGGKSSSRVAVNVEDGLQVEKPKPHKHVPEKKARRKVKKKSKIKDVIISTPEHIEINPAPEELETGASSRTVRFSVHVEVFPSSSDDAQDAHEKHYGQDHGHEGASSLVQGKWFTPEEDALIREAVSNYIATHNLGENGEDMILNCKSHPEARGCWNEIASELPWRTRQGVYSRAHILLERGDRNWTAEELECIQNFYNNHGPNWRLLANALGKNRIHTKDAFRRIKLPNLKRGRWSQEEYQTLFDLVNMDLRMRAFDRERKSKHGMLRDAISWDAISERMSTRTNSGCCSKWYTQLSSPMCRPRERTKRASSGSLTTKADNNDAPDDDEILWEDTDDYRLIDALLSLDATCMEDVEWDNLLEHRSGTVCRKRWNQMVKHTGDHASKSFADQVEVLSKRYCLDVLEAREVYNSKPLVG